MWIRSEQWEGVYTSGGKGYEELQADFKETHGFRTKIAKYWRIGHVGEVFNEELKCYPLLI